MTTVDLNLMAGWSGIVLGFVSGGLMGLGFRRDDWLGGYGALRRRMVRLGHIAFFGLGFVNIAFALSIAAVAIQEPWQRIASAAFIVGAATMPLCCYLTAYRERHWPLFHIPVFSLLLGAVALVIGWRVL